MVGMLIPPGAQVKLTRGIFEPFTQFAVGTHRNKHTPLTSREPIVTVVKRGKLDGTLTRGNFQKVVRLPNEIIRKDNLAYKNGEIMVDPDDIEFPDSQPESGEGTEEAQVTEEASAAAALVSGTADPPQQQGGQQRTTRKHKNSIIGSAKKSRTYR
jgi:hypothetical protein